MGGKERRQGARQKQEEVEDLGQKGEGGNKGGGGIGH